MTQEFYDDGKCYFCKKKLRGKFPNYLTYLDQKARQVISVFVHASCYKKWIKGEIEID